MGAVGFVRGLSRRRRVFLAVVLVVVVGLAAVLAVRLAGGRSAADPVATRSGPGPVLLVPGYGGSTSALTVLAGRLRSAGRTAEVVALPGDGTGDLLAQVDVLNTAVQRAVDGGAASVDVVGYSAGGVVTRLWIARDGASRARRVVTLGSPLHGTGLAAAGAALVPGACPLACQQLAPGSALLRTVSTQPLPHGLPWLSLWTEDDQTVTPPDSARLTGAVNVAVQQICPGIQVSHGQLPTSPLVDGIVLAALTGPALTAPRPGQCSALTRRGGG